MTLSPLDWAIIVIYLVGCMVAGIWMWRYSSHVDDFTVAGREVDVNLGIASPWKITSASATNPMNFSTGHGAAAVKNQRRIIEAKWPRKRRPLFSARSCRA